MCENNYCFTWQSALQLDSDTSYLFWLLLLLSSVWPGSSRRDFLWIGSRIIQSASTIFIHIVSVSLQNLISSSSINDCLLSDFCLTLCSTKESDIKQANASETKATTFSGGSPCSVAGDYCSVTWQPQTQSLQSAQMSISGRVSCRDGSTETPSIYSNSHKAPCKAESMNFRRECQLFRKKG